MKLARHDDDKRHEPADKVRASLYGGTRSRARYTFDRLSQKRIRSDALRPMTTSRSIDGAAGDIVAWRLLDGWVPGHMDRRYCVYRREAVTGTRSPGRTAAIGDCNVERKTRSPCHLIDAARVFGASPSRFMIAALSGCRTQIETDPSRQVP